LHWSEAQTTNGTLVVKNNLFDQNQASGFVTDQPEYPGGTKHFFVISNQFLNNAGVAVMMCSSWNGADISSNLIRGNPSGMFFGRAYNATIAGNTIMGCTTPAYTAGIAIDIYQGNPVIQNNLITDNRQGVPSCNGRCSMINVYSIGLPTVQNNTFWGNQAEALIYFNYGGGGTYTGNNFQYNQVQYIFYREPQSPAGANATGNYWGTINTAIIDSLIYDFYDDFNPGTISYTPILSAPNPSAPSPKRTRGQSTSQ
jgi:nitrous oxidase accessory protein NosD